MALCFGSRGPWLILRKMMVCFHPTLPLRTGQHCSKMQEVQNTQCRLIFFFFDQKLKPTMQLENISKTTKILL